MKPSLARPDARASRPGRLRGPAVAIVLALALGGTTAACGADHGGATTARPVPSPTSVAAAATHAVPRGHVEMPTGHEITAAWESRPAYVQQAHGDTQMAYAYALARPDVLQWLPCYCGCSTMGHRSNLDCFLLPRQRGVPIAFEEHGSYCDVCVKTALMAQRMLGEGKTMLEIRQAVDGEFGDLAPGTDTLMPPAG